MTGDAAFTYAHDMTNDHCLIFYHGNDWDWVPSRQRYLMEALSEYVPIVYLDSGRSSRGRVTYHPVAENVTVVKGLISMMIALRRRKMEKASTLLGHWHLRWVRKKHKRVIFWAMENWLRPYRFIPHDVLVYDSIDPVFDRRPEVVKEFERREIEVLRAAHKAFASADSLVDFCKRHHSNVTLLNNACAPIEYEPKLIAAAPKPGWWPESQKPVAAYLGSIDERFDFDCAMKASRDNPQVQFVFAGSVIPALSTRVTEMQSLPNVLCPGRISVGDGRYLLSRCTIGLIPFILGEMNDAINPVKMYAYALLGKPIAGTATREMAGRPDVVVTGSTPEEFSVAVREALKRAGDPETETYLKSYALRNTWQHRAAQAWQEIRDL